jgi:hypothetical protein
VSNQANIRDIQILSNLKTAFGCFGEDVLQVLAALEKQFGEIQGRLEERQEHWQRQVDAAQEAVYEARRSLNECESEPDDEEGNSPDCSSEAEQVSDAERDLAVYEENLEIVKQWRHRIESQIADFQNDIHRLSDLASSRTSSAQAFLASKIEILDRYVVGSSSASAAMHGLSGYDNIAISVPTADPSKEKLISAALQAHEEVLAKRIDTEKLIALDAQGKAVLERSGDQNSVAIFNSDKPLLKDMVLTHNHPMGRSFSEADLRTTQEVDLAELRAVGVGQPYTYVLKRPATGWPVNMAERYGKISKQLEAEFALKVKRGEIAAETAEQIFAHGIMTRLAAELKLDYEQKPRP